MLYITITTLVLALLIVGWAQQPASMMGALLAQGELETTLLRSWQEKDMGAYDGARMAVFGYVLRGRSFLTHGEEQQVKRDLWKYTCTPEEVIALYRAERAHRV